jgi:hypothetical protein
MNSKQRRRFIRQYKEKIELDRVINRLENQRPRWFDSNWPEPGMLYEGEKEFEYKPRLDFYYAMHIRSKENDT